MGVRVIVDEEEEECASSYSAYSTTSATATSTNSNLPTATCCHACGATKTAATTCDKNQSKTSSEPTASFPLNKPPTVHFSQTNILGLHHYTRASRDLVGNCKEYRIENNTYDLRIIGNCNRVRIGENAGSIHIIGNSTRLKIKRNSGHIRYTGNDGRICLGNESTQQTVDYIGCNGILKIVNALELYPLRSKCKKSPKSGDNLKTGNAKQHRSPTADAATNPTAATPIIPKSASYAGHECRGAKYWTHFDGQFQRQSGNWYNMANMSLPNLQTNYKKTCKCGCKCCESKGQKANQENCPVNVINNIGNIVIKNAINVKI